MTSMFEQFIQFLTIHSYTRYMSVLCIFIFLLFFLLFNRQKKALLSANIPKMSSVNSTDIASIGDDAVATQLDLARAYIEMQQYVMAEEMLQGAMQNGTPAQQQEAKQLLSAL